MRTVSAIVASLSLLGGLSTSPRALGSPPPPLAPAPAPAAATPPAFPPAARPPALVRVHLDAPPGTELEARAESQGWHTACASPCDSALPLDREYRIAGESRRGASFRLQARRGDSLVLALHEELHATRESRDAWIVGTVGGGAAVIGLGVLVYGLRYCGVSSGTCASGGPGASFALGGGVALGTGLAVVLAGAVMAYVADRRDPSHLDVIQTLARFPTPPGEPDARTTGRTHILPAVTETSLISRAF